VLGHTGRFKDQIVMIGPRFQGVPFDHRYSRAAITNDLLSNLVILNQIDMDIMVEHILNNNVMHHEDYYDK